VVQIADNLPLDSLTQAVLGTLKAQADEQNISIKVGTHAIDPVHF
jgi:hypothetical protein